MNERCIAVLIEALDDCHNINIGYYYPKYFIKENTCKVFAYELLMREVSENPFIPANISAEKLYLYIISRKKEDYLMHEVSIYILEMVEIFSDLLRKE